MRTTSLAFLAVIGLAAGCESGSSTGPEPITFEPGPAPSGQGFVALFAPPVDVGPYPSDFYNPTGAKVTVPERVTSPLAAAVNTLDGFSTTAPISAPFNAPIDPATLVAFNPLAPSPTATVFVLNASAGTPLVPGTDYALRVSEAAGTQGSVLEIVPLHPLAERTRYAFILTSGIHNTFGVAAGADTVFRAVRDAHLAGLTSVPGQPALDPLFPAIAPLIDLAQGTLGLPGDAVIAAWTMQTQSIGAVLEVIEQTATPRPAVLAPTGMTTAALGLGLPGLADIYVGFLEIPYFGDPATPLESFWVTAQGAPPTAADPVPVARVPNLRIPLLATLPNAASGHAQQPAAGWPVVIFQHGVTANRTLALAVADAFAQAGFAVVAIDLPLHGVLDPASPFYQGQGSPFGANERHFEQDNVGDVGVLTPDGQIDNGWQLFNVANPLNARDHVRQAVSDLIHLTRTIPTLDFPDGDTDPDLDGARIHFLADSLGSIISGVFLGLNTEVRTATLGSAAGPWTAILTDPQAVQFGEPIRNALAAQGLPPGTAGFDQFVRDLQTVIDTVDPVNYAADATANHPLHVFEVLGDTTVPNGPVDYLASLWGLQGVSATTAVPPPATVRGIVRFTAGVHSSLVNAAPNPAVTTELQTQAVTYAATDGSVIQISDTSVVQ
ncbi:MAG TPA: hypothetical protein VF322_05715 [Gammaproteobacteria bacterium]